MKYVVILHVFNEEEYLETVLDAIRLQSYPPEDIVIVDDGSTDETPNIIHEQGIAHIHRPSTTLQAFKRRAHAFNDAVDLAKIISPKAQHLLKVDGDTHIEQRYAFTLLRNMKDPVIAATSGISTEYYKVRDLNNGAVLYRLRTLPKARSMRGWDRGIQLELIRAGYTIKIDPSVSYTDLRMPNSMKPTPSKVILNRTSRMLSEAIGKMRRITARGGNS